MCVDKREISIQADIAIEKNKNFKKEESQRQKEKQQKAAELKEKKEEKPVVSGPVEEPTNEYEKKVFDVLNAMGIAHVREREEKRMMYRQQFIMKVLRLQKML